MNRESKRMLQRQGPVQNDGLDVDGSSALSREPLAVPSPRGGGAARTAGPGRTGPAEFLREVRGELRKVAWPSRTEVTNYSTVVLITLVLLVGFIFALNYGFAKAITFLFQP